MSLAIAGGTKTRTRRVAVTPGYGRITLTIAREGIYLRRYRGRKDYLLPYGIAFQRAVMLHVDHERSLKPRKKRRSQKRR